MALMEAFRWSEGDLFNKICVGIREESSQEIVMQLFGCLDASVSLSDINSTSISFTPEELFLDLSHWTKAYD